MNKKILLIVLFIGMLLTGLVYFFINNIFVDKNAIFNEKIIDKQVLKKEYNEVGGGFGTNKIKNNNLVITNLLKDFGSGILLKQNDEKTFVTVNDKIVYEEKNELESFSGGFACDHFNLCPHYPDAIPNNDLDEIKKQLAKRINAKYMFGDIVIVYRSTYSGTLSILINTKTLKQIRMNTYSFVPEYINDDFFIISGHNHGGSFIDKIDNDFNVESIFSPKDGGKNGDTFTNMISNEIVEGKLIIKYNYSKGDIKNETKVLVYDLLKN